MRVGFVYNVRSEHALAAGDEDAEFDDPATIAAIGDAIAAHGHDVVGLEADATLPRRSSPRTSTSSSTSPKAGSRSREAQVPRCSTCSGFRTRAATPWRSA